MMSSYHLALAKQRVSAGTLPDTMPAVTLGGFSGGAECALCETPIEPNAPEIEFTVDERTFLVHPECYAAWSTVVRGSRSGPGAGS